MPVSAKEPLSFETGFLFLDKQCHDERACNRLSQGKAELGWLLHVPFAFPTKISCHVRKISNAGVSHLMKNQPFYKRAKFALHGIRAAFRLESSFRLQCSVALAVVFILVYNKSPAIWWTLLLMNCGLVLAAEMFNTALEHLIDHLHPELHPSIKIAKDCAAGAVLILSLSAVCVFVAFLIETTSI